MKPSGENQPQNEESLDDVNTNHLSVSLPMQNNSLPKAEVGKDSAGSGETNPSLTLGSEHCKSDSASPGVTHPTPKATMKCSNQPSHLWGVGLVFLYLFAGPVRDHDGFAAYCKKFGAKVDEYDLLRGHDLVNDDVWSNIKTNIKAKKYHGILTSPPCESFCGARNDADGGPRVLRGAQPPEVYGLKDLIPPLQDWERDKVQIGNMCVFRSVEGGVLQLKESVIQINDKAINWPYVYEQP